MREREREIEKKREREREKKKEHIEADAGADTKATTKMRKRRNKNKKKNNKIETHTWLRGPRRRWFSQRFETPTRFPTSAAHHRTSRIFLELWVAAAFSGNPAMWIPFGNHPRIC